MPTNKDSQTKLHLHPRNKNRERYDLNALVIAVPELKGHVIPNKYGTNSVDFSNPKAVKLLNRALLTHDYGIADWDFSDLNLCPPIPGRADYIHYIADLLAEGNQGVIPAGDQIVGLDIGVGASCIYPIIGVAEYGWRFIGSDIDPKSIASSNKIINDNALLKNKIITRLQENPTSIFHGILTKNEKVDFTMCNPPFHSSIEEAQKGSRRKIKNLTGKKVKDPQLNFSGNHNELIYPGGESGFITNMAKESTEFAQDCYWFTTLVSKDANLKSITKRLAQMKAQEVKVIPMGTANKTSRIVAWTFLTAEEKQEWSAIRGHNSENK
tara:strand:- start:3989 stop:4963 length:975 start_codon:yes stop_codon:yes gene_type:complete